MNERPNLFAIRGYMKSGTNWVCNLLNLHPHISCVGEFHWERVVEPFCRNVDTMIASGRVRDFNDEAILALKDLIATTIRAANRPDAVWAGDRTPGAISPDLFPEARYIHLIRDGRDVLVSRAFHLLRRPETSQLFAQDDDLKHNLSQFQNDPRYFEDHPHELLRSERMVRQTVQSWTRIVRQNLSVAVEHPEVSVFELRYEDLHVNTEDKRQSMYQFLDLDPNLAGSLTSRTKAGFKNEDPSKFFRKGAVGDWKNYFTDEVDQWFQEESSGLLEQLGYSVS